jgi:hydrocephalus-inducing protein
VTFRPTARINAFKVELNYKIVENQEKKKLLNIFTAAHGIEMKLMEDTVGFGTVVVQSKMTKTIQLSNFGDIGSKFEWDTSLCGKFFTIEPAKGYLLAHEDILFNVSFHPNAPNNDIRFRAKCIIEGIDPLYVNLVGKCIPQPQETIQ